jgi:hypothetical protein
LSRIGASEVQPVRLHALSQKGSFSVRPQRHRDARTSQRRLPATPDLDEEILRVLVLAACDFLSNLETGCRSRSDRQFIRPMVEAQMQSELYEVLLG